jgi:uncharacterized protein involved in exopolysaccharide biosynthesis
LKNYWWIILAAVIVGIGSTALFAQRRTPVYVASATVVVGPNSALTEPRVIVDSLNALDRRSVVATLARLPSSRTVRDRSAQHLGVSPQQLALYSVRTVVVPDTNVLEMSVEGPDRRLVAAFANEIAGQTIAYAQDFYTVYALRLLDRASEPGHPTGPDLSRKLLAGGLLGLLIGLAAAFLLDRGRRAEDRASESPHHEAWATKNP